MYNFLPRNQWLFYNFLPRNQWLFYNFLPIISPKHANSQKAYYIFNIGAYLVYHCKSIGFSLESRRLYSETPLQ